MRLLNTPEYVQMRREALSNDGITPTQFNAPDLVVWDTTRYTDFQKMLIGNSAPLSDAQVSISGGSGQTQFLLGAGYHHETTVFPGNYEDNHASFNANIHHASSNQIFKLDWSAIYSHENNNLPISDLTQSALLAPNAPALLDPVGNLVWQEKDVSFLNPLSALRNDYTALTNNLLSNLQIGLSLSKALIIRCSFGYNTLSSDDQLVNPIAAQNPQYHPTGSLSIGTKNYSSWIIEPQSEYTTTIYKGKLSVLIGGTFMEVSNSSSAEFGTGFTSDALINNLAAAPSISIEDVTRTAYRYQAIFCRINYNWNQQYVFNLSGVVDG
jgi:hypothetical protein